LRVGFGSAGEAASRRVPASPKAGGLTGTSGMLATSGGGSGRPMHGAAGSSIARRSRWPRTGPMSRRQSAPAPPGAVVLRDVTRSHASADPSRLDRAASFAPPHGSCSSPRLPSASCGNDHSRAPARLSNPLGPDS
jgi:hypothetical protein